jgi:hypothetical protein
MTAVALNVALDTAAGKSGERKLPEDWQRLIPGKTPLELAWTRYSDMTRRNVFFYWNMLHDLLGSHCCITHETAAGYMAHDAAHSTGAVVNRRSWHPRWP